MPTLTVAPTSAPLGSTVKVTGINFSPRITVNLYFNRAQVAKFKATTAGDFYTYVEIPPNVGIGTHVIKAITRDGETSVSITATAVAPTPIPEPPPTSTHPADTVWVDDFNGTTLDTTKWRVSNYGVTTGGRKCCGTNHANYASEVSVSNGSLHLGAHLIGGVWHTGCIDTETKKLFGYGIWEASIKVPRGTGLWPAFWGYDGSGEEIDVLEACTGPNGTRGGNDVTMVHQGIHRYNDSPRIGTDTDMGVDMSLAFHTYGVEYRSGFVQFSVDGVKRGSQISPSLVKTMPLILNLGVGGTWCGNPDASTPTANTMSVDWVRVRS